MPLSPEWHCPARVVGDSIFPWAQGSWAILAGVGFRLKRLESDMTVLWIL